MTIKKACIYGFLTGAAFIALSFPAHAQDPLAAPYAAEKVPPYSAELVVEWQNEYRADSDDDAIDETNNSFLRSELAPHVALGEYFYVDGVLVFEPFDQAAEVNEGDDIWFDREGVFVEELKLNFEYGPYAVWAGKFNPAFGKAWDFGRGIWSEDFAEDYEITEKIGAGASCAFETENAGSYTIAATAFFADTTVLSEGWITDRDDVSLPDGGASNTEDLSSFTISAEGENAAGVENLSYIIAYRHLAEQEEGAGPGTDDENGIVLNAGYVIPVNDNLSFDLMGEYAGIRGFEGVKDADRDYYSVSAVATINQNWNIAVGGTLQDIEEAGPDFNDHLLQVSGGYDFGNGFTVEAGWRSSEEAHEDTNIIGTLVRYTHAFE